MVSDGVEVTFDSLKDDRELGIWGGGNIESKGLGFTIFGEKGQSGWRGVKATAEQMISERRGWGL